MKKQISASRKNLKFLVAAIALFLSFSIQATNLFWIGGTGNWNDAANWSTTSGGAAGAVIPTAADNVFFDANSFTAPSQTITINSTATCADMDWTGAAFNPVLNSNGGAPLNIYGSLTFIPAMTFVMVNSDVYFKATTTGKTITSAGLTFNTSAYFDGVGGSWTLNDAFTGNGYFSVGSGSVSTNNNNITCGYLTSNSGLTRGLNLGTSIVNITASGGTFNISTNGLSFNGTSSTINFTNNGTLNGGSQALNNVNWTNSTSNGSLTDGLSYNKITFTGTGDINPLIGTYYSSVDFQKMGYLNNSANGNFGKVTFSDNGVLYGNNSFDSLIFAPGKTYTLNSGITQTINTYAKIDGTCSQPITIKSSVAGSITTLSSSTASITTSFTRIQDVTASGGANFIANNSINLGNNTGWTINAPSSQDLYWVGGSGNWNDANHWSTTSGGAAGTCIPTRYDDVYFDANSFTAGSKVVTLNVIAECDSMNWTGATNTPILTGTLDLNIFGSLKLISAMSNSFNGILNFKSTTGGNMITSAGKSFSNRVNFDGIGGDWTLQDAFNVIGTTGDIYLLNGYLVTNDKTVSMYSFQSSGNGVRGLYLMNSTINVAAPWQSVNSWYVLGSNFTVDAGTSIIKLTAAFNANFVGGAGNYYYDIMFMDATNTGTVPDGAGYHDVTFNGLSTLSAIGATFNIVTFSKDAYVSGANNTFTKAVFLANATLADNGAYDTISFSGGKTYTLNASKTQSVNTIIATSSCTQPVIIQSSTPGTKANISSNLNNITVNYFQIQDINATGGMTFVANNSTDVGNNSGWTINPAASLNLYWRGGSGNWNDPTHWSLTNGGAGGACIPTAADNVFFTSLSFTAGSKVVTLNVPAYCKNMSWTGATFTPVFTGTVSLNVYGSLTFISGMTTTGFTGKLNFKSTTTGNTITSAGKTFTNHVYFDGLSGGWALQDALNLSSTADLYLNAGALNTNNKNVTANAFWAGTTKVKQLILGATVFTITGTTGANTWNVLAASNFSVTPGTSHIKFTNTTTAANFNPYNEAYYDVTFYNTTGGVNALYTSVQGGSYHTVTCYGATNIYFGTFHKLQYTGAGTSKTSIFSYSNIMDSLILAPGTTTNIDNSSVLTLNNYLGANGTAGNLVTLTGSNTYTINVPSCVVCCNYASINKCFAGGGASFYADNSTNVGGNTGWTFAACPSATLTVGPITGVTNTCANTTGYTYSIPAIAGATYTWTVPGGNIITSGQGSASIQVAMAGTAGTISVTASACGTSSSATKTITVNPIPVVSSVSVTAPTNCIDPDGSATATITGGSAPFSYQWSSGDILATADSLYSGQYQLTVSDLYGCITSTVVTINSVGGPTLTLGSSANVTCPGGNNGSLTGSVTGGNTPYTYAWTSGATTATANNLQAGTYVLTVTDSAGCQVVANYTVTQPSPLSLVINTSPSACSGTSGSATVVASGGTAGYTYLWSSNAASQTTAAATALAAGLYTVTVTDNAGCTSNGSAMVSTNTAGASISLDNITAGTCGTNGPGSIDVTTSGGATPYTYSWSNGASTEDITGASPGTYSLGVIDGNGCMTFTTYIVPNANPGYQPQICVVTFDTTSGSNLVAWEKTGAVGIQAYNIYCEIGSFNNYQLVGTVPAGSLSEFIHPGANADVKSWKYKISAVDSCGTETPLSSYHKTIHLQISQNGSVNNLSWDNYFGFNYGSFEVWRHAPSTNWQMLSTISFCGFTVCQNGFTDFTPVPGDTNRYAILVNAPQPCLTTARLANGSDIQGSIVKTRSNVKNNRSSAIGITEGSLKNNYAVYPNPTSKEITVQLNKNCVNCELEITNALGQTLKIEKLLSLDNKINVSGFANGVYYLKIKNSSATDVQKLIIQH